MRLVNVLKPTHICNLNCDYCYNDDERQPIMTIDTLRRTIEQTFEYARSTKGFTGVEFVWHGGEPLVAGLPYFEAAMRFQEELANGLACSNVIQTNGLLLNDAWTGFFKSNGFSVSVSLDGTQEMHDAYRKDHAGKGSFAKVLKAIELLRKGGIEPGVVLVATKAMIGKANEIYRFLVDNALPFQIVTLTKSGNARDKYSEMALSQAEYAELWIALFDQWFAGNPGYVRSHEFENRLSALMSGMPRGCEALANCADTNISVDPVGDVYTCGTLSGTASVKYGNIVEQDLVSLMVSPTAIHFRTRVIDPQCASCEWQHVCHGGCMSRAFKMYGTIDRRDNKCEALGKTWSHMAKQLKLRELDVAPPHPNNRYEEFALDPSLKLQRPGLRGVIPILAR